MFHPGFAIILALWVLALASPYHLYEISGLSQCQGIRGWLCCMCQHLPSHLNRGLPQLYNVWNVWLLNELTLDELWHMDLLSAVLLTSGRLATTVCHKALIRSTPNDICSQTLLCRWICKWLVRYSLDLSCIIDRVWGLVYEGYCKYLNLSSIDWHCLGSCIRK